MRRTLALMLLCSMLLGCELVANFDRSRIPSEDAGTRNDAGAQPKTAADASAGTQPQPAADASAGTGFDDAGGP